MIQGLHNGQLPRKPEELKARGVQALQQQNAARELQKPGQDNKELAPHEQVALSSEISDELNGAYKQDQHQGLDALLANWMGPQEPKKLEVDKINEVGKGSEAVKIKHNPAKKPQVRELKDDEKHAQEKTKDPKAADRMGNLKVSSKKEAQGLKDKPQQPGSEQTHSHHKAGSKGAPKTDAPRPVGATEQMKGPKPDGKVGLRQLPQMRNNGADKTDFSEEIKQALAAQKPAVA